MANDDGSTDLPLLQAVSTAEIDVTEQPSSPYNAVPAAAVDEVKSIESVQYDKLTEIDEKEFKLEVPVIPAAGLAQTIGLMGSIASMMTVATSFVSSIPTADQQAFGTSKFEAVRYVLTFFPMVFACTVLIIYNTHNSRVAFYQLLRRRVIVDFPPSALPGHMVRNLYPVLFMTVAIFYLAFSLWAFIYFLAPIGLWIIFFKQYLMEICLAWYDLQTVETSLVTLPEFIEACDDRHNEGEGVIDNYTVNRAAALMMSFQAVRTRASYKAFTSKFTVRKSKLVKWMIRLGILIVVGALCAVAWLQFENDQKSQDLQLWQGSVAPCVQVCFERSGRTQDSCFDCVCACETAVGASHDSDLCERVLVLPGCNIQSTCRAEGSTCFSFD